MSFLRSTSASSPGRPGPLAEEAQLDTMATGILKSNGRAHVCVRLEPLVPGLAQFIWETSRDCDFMETLACDQPGLDTEELYHRYRLLSLRGARWTPSGEPALRFPESRENT